MMVGSDGIREAGPALISGRSPWDRLPRAACGRTLSASGFETVVGADATLKGGYRLFQP